MVSAAPPPRGAGEDFVLHLDQVQADQVRHVAAAWMLTVEQALAGLVSHQLGACAAAVVDLVPGPPTVPRTRGH